MITSLIILVFLLFASIFRSSIRVFTLRVIKGRLAAILSVGTLIFIILLIVIKMSDKELYYSGRSIFNYGILPHNIKPIYKYEFPSEFVLQRSGEKLIGKGIQYKTSDFIINKILKYGYNQKEVVAIANDTLRKEFCIILKGKDKNRARDELEIKVISKDSIGNKENFKWVDPYNPLYNKIELRRNYLIFVLLAIVSTLIYIAFLAKKNSQQGKGFSNGTHR